MAPGADNRRDDRSEHSEEEAVPILSAQPNGNAPGNATERDNSSATEYLSRLMLEGWTMLADTCPRPDCHMPLARSRQGRVVCCACRLDVVRSSLESSAPSTAAVGSGGDVAPPSPPASASVPDGDVSAQAHAAETGVVTVRAGSCSTEAAAASRGALSTALGEKLLQGWTMVERACNTCATPLLRAANGALVCVSCAGANVSVPPTQRQPPPTQTGEQRSRPIPLHLPAGHAAAARARARAIAPPSGPSGGAGVAHQNVGLGMGTECTVVEMELKLAEEATVDSMRRIRESLQCSLDVESMRAALAALREAAETIASLRKAKRAVL